MKNKLLLRFSRRVRAAELLAERCDMLQEKIEIMEIHLAISRQMLATAIRDKDKFEGALDRVCRELALLKKQQRQKQKQMRTWMTRCLAVNPSEN